MPQMSHDELNSVFAPKLHWVQGIDPHRLALTPRPGKLMALNQQIKQWQQSGIDVVLSLLEPDEAVQLGVDKEPALCVQYGMEFLSLPIPDHGTPKSATDVAAMVETVHQQLLGGKGVAIHCHAGIGRTGIVAACVLNELQVPTHNILPLLSASRGYDMPQWDAQIEWIEQFIRERGQKRIGY